MNDMTKSKADCPTQAELRAWAMGFAEVLRPGITQGSDRLAWVRLLRRATTIPPGVNSARKGGKS